MKRVLFIISLIFIGLSVKAQDGEYHVRIHGQENKGIVLDAPVSSIDSMYVNENGKLKVRTTNNLYSFDFTEVDSLTFPFIPASTGDIVYINYNGTSAEVINPYPVTQVIVTVSEAKVSITSLISSNITYVLSGTANPGRFAIESVTTPTIKLNGVNLTNPTGKAMDLTCDSGVILEIVDGTTNSLSDGTESDKKAALMSNSDLLVQGNGTLNVTSFVKHPIKVKGICTINSGNFVITSDVEDVNGLSADSTLVINGGSFNITMNGDISKGIKCDDNMTINGGDFTIVAAGSTIEETVNNQVVPSYCTAIKCDNNININGGTFNITLPTTNHGGKSISADGNITITDGTFDILTQGDGAAYTVTGSTKDSYTSSCLKCDGNMEILGGNLLLRSTGAGGKGINSGGTMKIGLENANNDDLILNVTTSGERITVEAGSGGGWWPGGEGEYANPKAIKADSNLTINSGNITVNCTQTQNEGGECIESKAILTINGGNIEAYSKKDDAVNASNQLIINGGIYYVHSDANDGTDCNGTMQLNGGFCISNGSRSPEEGFDCDNNQFKITGGTHIGTGGGTSNPTSSVCTQPSMKINTQPGYAIQILKSDGTVVCTYQCPTFTSGGGGGPGGGGNSMVMLFTDPQLQTGQTYTIKYNGTISGGTNWNGYYTGNVTYSGGQSTTATLNSMYTTVSAGGGGGW